MGSKIKFISSSLSLPQRCLLSLLIILSSCSTTNLINYPDKSLKYNDELVSVNVALDLAMTSYLKSCVDLYKEMGKKQGSFFICKKKAIAHVKNNIVAILEQGEELRSKD